MPPKGYGETIKLIRWEDMSEERRRSLEAEWAAHEASDPHEPMECIYCMFKHYPVRSRSD